MTVHIGTSGFGGNKELNEHHRSLRHNNLRIMKAARISPTTGLIDHSRPNSYLVLFFKFSTPQLHVFVLVVIQRKCTALFRKRQYQDGGLFVLALVAAPETPCFSPRRLVETCSGTSGLVLYASSLYSCGSLGTVCRNLSCPCIGADSDFLAGSVDSVHSFCCLHIDALWSSCLDMAHMVL